MEVYLISGSRTPSGSFLGALSTVTAPKLGAAAIQGALEKANLPSDQVDKVYMGNVVQAGVGQAPARQAAIFAGLPEATPCTTINKVCGSGLESIILGAKDIALKDHELVVCGGMENMSLAPHLLAQSRTGTKFGKTELKDSMQWDGLWDVYSDRAMGNCAEECVQKYEFKREDQDAFAIESFKKAQKAIESGVFKDEITPVTLKTRKGEVVVDTDEGPMKANFEKIPTLRPAFDKQGTITAANASTINDGAAAVILGGEKYKDQAEFKIVSYATHAQNPTWFTVAPISAMKKCAEKVNLEMSDIDVFEINEAFAAVPMAAIKELGLSQEKVNIYGGGVSLGHPIGCSGTRIVVTLMNAMKKNNFKRGMASICIGGGEALAMIIERI
ncbi:MAG: thiolase family protein [Bacteriovoracaceae bacterium]